ncbi:B3 domain-containing protein Os01g0723500-like isoform X2 [Arachis stenosperma]|uniref:B3 domain-containing protein Os01g0723500-like isoform X2 n=1 Tax=Arachis stenosperma TaxID=217475 RepID=UPI0025AD63C4|nr:B3 domain-containing protein Os01g0723500-like isoform X2 [Arachis stenosperma]
MACESCGCEGNLNVRKPQFYEFYSSTPEKLKIPAAFIHHLQGRADGLVSVTGPSGKSWPVQLIKMENDMFFHQGWPSFVGDHRLECGDLLVFRYEGYLNFTVQVFDKNKCEKLGLNSECSQNSGNFDNIRGHKRDRSEKSSLDVIVEGATKKMRGNNADNQELKLSIVGKDILQYELVKPISMFKEKEETSRACSTNDIPLPFHVGNSNEDEDADQYILNGISLSNLAAHDEKKVARSFTSSFPYFVRIMKSFNVSGSYTLNIPYQFSMAHLPNCKIKIILHNLKGEHWTVNSVPSTRVHTSHTLCGGWMAFVRGNNIKVGDVCIFELVHECELLVRIAGGGKDLQDPVAKPDLSNPSAGHAITCHKASRYMSVNPKDNPKSVINVDQSVKKRSKVGQEAAFSIELRKSGKRSNSSKKTGLGNRTKAANKKLETAAQKRHRVEDELSSQANAGLRMLFALDEQRVAQAFTSPFPNFVKIMKKFNVSGSYTLKIPYQFSAAHLPAYKTEIILRNLRGESWTVNSVPDAKGRTVHTFCGGWMAFVRDNDINFGDTCIFELVAQGEMRVYISGVGKEGLENQNGQVKLNRLLANVPSTC